MWGKKVQFEKQVLRRAQDDNRYCVGLGMTNINYPKEGKGMPVRPGGEYAGRPLHIIWLLDCSGSMAEGGKIEALNNAIREVVPAMRKAAEGNPEVQFYVRVIRFSSGACWHIAQPARLSEFKWIDLQADGETDMGQALALLAEELGN